MGHVSRSRARDWRTLAYIWQPDRSQDARGAGLRVGGPAVARGFEVASACVVILIPRVLTRLSTRLLAKTFSLLWSSVLLNGLLFLFRSTVFWIINFFVSDLYGISVCLSSFHLTVLF